LIDDTNNLSGAKSITFTSSASNPGTGGTLWYNAGSGVMNIGSAKIVNAAASQTLTNKTLTAPIISSIANTGTITLPTDTTTLVGQNTTDTLTNKTITSATNLVDASALQTTGTAVKVSLAAPPTMGEGPDHDFRDDGNVAGPDCTTYNPGDNRIEQTCAMG
jgi:hypothetical protein